MIESKKLSDVIKFNTDFKNAVNLYLSLNKKEKILSYIPTQSSIRILSMYLQSIYKNRAQATLLIGPYGKGKSHLLLVLLAIISMERNDSNKRVIKQLIDRICKVDEIGNDVCEVIENIWNEKRYLPVIITDSKGDLNQSFLYALHEALVRENLDDLIPDTYYSIAIKRIKDWKVNYPDTYIRYEEALKRYGRSAEQSIAELKQYSKVALEVFKEIYPEITSGSEFNPLAVSEVLPLYKSVSEKLNDLEKYNGIYIVFDEFSKFIEGQDKLNTGNNMKLLQDICELATESKQAQIFITMVAHKSVKEYGKYLSTEIINSFTGIEGRLEERYFITSFKNNYELIQNAIQKEEDSLKAIPQYQICTGEQSKERYYQLLPFKTNFNLGDFEKIILKGCYPLSPVSAYLLLNISEKVAQNERTLFTFISKNEQYSMARFVSEHTEDASWSIGADLIYDYFSNLFKKEVANEFIHNEWLNAEYAISKSETKEEQKIIKALAIILIVNKEDELPATKETLCLASGVPDGIETISKLVDKQLIYKKGATNSYVFKTRAGSALKMEIKKCRSLKGDSVNISHVLASVMDKYFVLPKKYNTDYMMTRYFRHEYMNVEDFLNIQNPEVFFGAEDLADGMVISLYALREDNWEEQIKERVLFYKDGRLVVKCTDKPFELIKQARDYEIVQELKENQVFVDNNEVLKRELPLLEEDLSKELSSHIESIFDENIHCKVLFYDSEKVEALKGDKEETAVNLCCERVYYQTPVINNELINRRVLRTAQTRKSRKVIVEAILNHKDDESFYVGTNQEATIYRSLFKVTKILEGEPEESIKKILCIINEFIDSCSDNKQLLVGLIKKLVEKPYGMREGVIPIYLSYILSKRKEDIVVYFSKMEVQITSDIVINMCEAPQDYSLFVSKEDVQKEKYIKNLQKLFRVEESYNLTDSRIHDILICMQRWFRALPQVTRNIEIISKYDAKGMSCYLGGLRNLLQKADINPYEIIFVKIPEMFNCKDNLVEAYNKISLCKKAFDEYYEWILQEAVDKTFEVFSNKKKEDLFHILKEWYDKQSDISKKGLYSGNITKFMTCIEKIDIYDDVEITKKLVKAVTGIYVENWNDNSYEQYVESLQTLKKEVESIREDVNEGRLKLSFTGTNGKEITRFYDRINEGEGSVLKNIIEDALDEYDDLSVNNRVAILLEMIEKVIG